MAGRRRRRAVRKMNPAAKAVLTAGTEVLRVAVPHGTERYLRLFYIVDTGPLTAGKFTSGLVPLRQANVAYASGYVA